MAEKKEAEKKEVKEPEEKPADPVEVEEKPTESVATEKPADEPKKESTTEKKPETSAVNETKVEEIEPELTNEYRLPSSGSQKPLHHHSVKRIVIVAIVMLVIAIFAAGAIWLTHDDPVDEINPADIVYSQGAAITAVEGDVEYSHASGVWTAVEPGTNLSEADSVRTLKASRAIITLDDGSAVRLNSDTTVTLTKLTVSEVEIDNDGGEVYTRVTPSETRKFYVYVNDQPYFAMGTAYMTVNLTDEEGVEVYHSKVKTKDSKDVDKEISEGEAFYAKNKNADQVDKISKLDIEKLKDNEFLKWNKAKDEAKKEFADKLGVLKDIDKPKQEEEKEEQPPVTPDGISASGAKVDDGIKVSWTVKNVDTNLGFKVAYSKTDTTPSYGEDSAKYVEAGKSSIVLGLTDGKVWHIRVCAYRGDGVCESYSNTVSVTAPVVEKEKVTRGTMTAELNGDTLSWSYTGKAIYGYKVVWNTSGNPTYPTSGDNKGYKYLSATSLSLPDAMVRYDEVSKKYVSYPNGDYYINVCAYTSGTESEACVDYSTPIYPYTINN